jgi:excisionase family DNA binding protein
VSGSGFTPRASGPLTSHERLLTDQEVAARLRVSPRTVSRMRRRGEISYLKLPGGGVRVPLEDLTAFEEACRKSPLRATREPARPFVVGHPRWARPSSPKTGPMPRSAREFDLGFASETSDTTGSGVDPVGEGVR